MVRTISVLIILKKLKNWTQHWHFWALVYPWSKLIFMKSRVLRKKSIFLQIFTYIFNCNTHTYTPFYCYSSWEESQGCSWVSMCGQVPHNPEHLHLLVQIPSYWTGLVLETYWEIWREGLFRLGRVEVRGKRCGWRIKREKQWWIRGKFLQSIRIVDTRDV